MSISELSACKFYDHNNNLILFIGAFKNTQGHSNINEQKTS